MASSHLISGAQFRGDMHFLSLESLRAAWLAMPQVIDHLVSTSNVVFIALGAFGIALLLVQDRWFGSLLIIVGVINVYFYANYLGDLSHYLLATWLILAIGLAVSVDWAVDLVVGVVGTPGTAVQFAILVLPVVLLASNWSAHDQSANQDGERLTEQIFAALPPNAVLITYWDTLTPLSYKHCVEGVRPDVSLRAYDEAALVTCDPVEAIERPGAAPAGLRPDGPRRRARLGDRSDAGPRRPIKLPWGQRYPQSSRSLYRLYPPDRRRERGPSTRRLRAPRRRRRRPGSSGSARGSSTGRTPGALGDRGAPDRWAARDLRFERTRVERARRRRAGPGPSEIGDLDPGAANDRGRPGRAVPGACRDAAVAARAGRGPA